MKGTDVRPLQIVPQVRAEYDEVEQARLIVAEADGQLRRHSGHFYPVCTLEIGPDGFVYRPLHFKTRDDALNFHKGRNVQLIIGERIEIK